MVDTKIWVVDGLKELEREVLMSEKKEGRIDGWLNLKKDGCIQRKGRERKQDGWVHRMDDRNKEGWI